VRTKLVRERNGIVSKRFTWQAHHSSFLNRNDGREVRR